MPHQLIAAHPSQFPLLDMSTSALVQLAAQFTRQMATAPGIGRKVAVLGAAGGIGQPLSMLMKAGFSCECEKTAL
jgi:NADPH:quinone reductase-like Zn-dependent oxidoreductase